jgi:SAM-dependent methyltransferase
VMGPLYERALAGERCWVRHRHGEIRSLPIERWLGRNLVDDDFDHAVLQMCVGPVIDVGCGPGRLVLSLAERGVCALGVDQSAAAVAIARRLGAPALHLDIFGAMPATGRWQTALLIDGNIGIGGDPHRLLKRVGELLDDGGHCLVEFDTHVTGIRTNPVRLESRTQVGPWFPWASAGVDSAEQLARECGFHVARVSTEGRRAVACLERA